VTSHRQTSSLVSGAFERRYSQVGLKYVGLAVSPALDQYLGTRGYL
jgi:hypothetical protein